MRMLWIGLGMACTPVPEVTDTLGGNPGIQVGAEGDDLPCERIVRRVADRSQGVGTLGPGEAFVALVEGGQGTLRLDAGPDVPLTVAMTVVGPLEWVEYVPFPEATMTCPRDAYTLPVEVAFEADEFASVFLASVDGRVGQASWFGRVPGTSVAGAVPRVLDVSLDDARLAGYGSRGGATWDGGLVWEDVSSGQVGDVESLGDWALDPE